ncbi:hypothetical protein MTP99_002930 [Tenebrio molitor]|jgi:hypothetical protein|nr:hypothetical protein MTP99_002930 [Tenebrio molitor]
MWLQLLLEKLDPETRKQIEAEIRSLGPAEVPKYTQLAEFVESQCRVLDSLGNCNSKSSSTAASSNPNFKSKTKSILLIDSSPSSNCSVCGGDHNTYKCPDFVSKTPRQRFEVVTVTAPLYQLPSFVPPIKILSVEIVVSLLHGKASHYASFQQKFVNSPPVQIRSKQIRQRRTYPTRN